jgi:hypothetical protein
MSASTLVSDADLARARHDPAFRHELVAGNLEFLLGTLNRLRTTQTDPQSARQIREGVDLAVQLAELLQRIAGNQPDTRQAVASSPY